MARMSVALVVAGLCFALAPARGENLLVNPSVEQGAAGQTPPGWGLYLGAGKARVFTATDESHSGKASACLELTGWLVPKDAADTPENRSVSAALVLAPNDGYRGRGALPGQPSTTYFFSFWYKGTLSSAKVSVTAWPDLEADHTKRISLSPLMEPLCPGPAWQRCAGTFRLPESAKYFALSVRAGGRQSENFRLGKLYIDDAEITARTYPDGQMRAIWCALPKAMNREAGVREVAEKLDKVKAAGLNTLFVWCESLYLASLSRPDLSQPDPRAAWDGLGEMIRAAGERGLQVHAWYSPWIYKNVARGIELREHPEWAAVNAKGVADTSGICLARPEVRQFQLDLIVPLIDRYPGLAGIHIEEPGYNWGQYCYCDYCKRLCREWYGLDIVAEPARARPLLDHLAASSCTDFILRLRQAITDRRPEMWLSANGSSGVNAGADWRIGRDWITWARRGYIDFYVPQIYTLNEEAFYQGGLRTREVLGACDLVTGMAVSWSGIYPRRQDPAVIQAQIRAAAKLGARGFAVYHFDHFFDEHFQAIREAVTAPPATAPAAQ